MVGKTKKRVTLLAAGLVIVPTALLTGCNGGSGGGIVVPSQNLLALATNGQILSFNSTLLTNVTTRNVTGLGAGESLVGIDYRFAPQGGAAAGLYGLARNNNDIRLYRLNTSGAGDIVATAVGAAVTIPSAANALSIDFNPVADRIRVVSTNGVNFRINPDSGAIVDFAPGTPGLQLDGNLAFAAGDTNAARTAFARGVAYTNNDSDASTGTVNYVLDATTNSLITQGRADDPATPADETVSPNEGTLFTRGTLGTTLNGNVGFDIGGTVNNAFTLFTPAGNAAPRLSQLNLTTGRATTIGSLATVQPIVDLAIVP